MVAQPTPSVPDLVAQLAKQELLEAAQLAEVRAKLQKQCPSAKDLAAELLRRGWLTAFQANQLLRGRGRELVLGQYVLLERLGSGGMGTVYKARHRAMRRLAAVKLIRGERLASPSARRRFEREIHAAARLTHPNIVHAYDADQVRDTYLLVMEYVEGGTDLSRLVKKDGPLPVGRACEYIRQAALGLQHAHEQGLVHRDVKPANLLLWPGELVKVTDLGLALVEQSEGEEAATALTRQGAVLGTADYAAPEQILSSRAADARSDVYALGCTLYFLLTGRPPFLDASPLEKLIKHQTEEPTPVERLRPEVPPAVAAVLRKMMAKKPADRYQTAAEVATSLEATPGNLGPATAEARGTGAAPPAEVEGTPVSPFAGLGSDDTREAGDAATRPRRRPLRALAAGLVGAVSAALSWVGRLRRTRSPKGKGRRPKGPLRRRP
jgi:serine/threonine protein kinase